MSNENKYRELEEKLAESEARFKYDKDAGRILLDEISKLEAKLAKAKRALYLYADSLSYCDYGTLVLEDGGDVARKTLEEIG